MDLLPGVYKAMKKNGDIYYRSSITYQNKHISLGSFSSAVDAHHAYKEAGLLIADFSYQIDDYNLESCILSFVKWVVIINFRDNKIYIKNPIYLEKKYFSYYVEHDYILKFDVDDLFYYSTHKIMKRGGYLFVSDYGMQVNVLSRYGIKNFAVKGTDFRFANGDEFDLRYGNIEIINKYHGVTRKMVKGTPKYITKIQINGAYIVGTYRSEAEAAIAYNKAAKLLKIKGVTKNFPRNYVVELDDIEYAKLLNMVKISRRVREFIL